MSTPPPVNHVLEGPLADWQDIIVEPTLEVTPCHHLWGVEMIVVFRNHVALALAAIFQEMIVCRKSARASAPTNRSFLYVIVRRMVPAVASIRSNTADTAALRSTIQPSINFNSL